MVQWARHQLARLEVVKLVKVRPGQKVPYSGQYKVVGSPDEITLVKGNTVPPNNSGEGKQEFILVDKTK